MKLISFNVNSLRAILNKSFKEDFARMNPDIIGIQETKLSDDKNFPFKPDGYEAYWTISKTKKGYSGTAVLTKIKPISIHYGLESGEYDDEGRVITLGFDKFYFVTSYSPNSQDGLKRLEYRQIWEDEIRKYLLKLNQKKPVIMCGDLNVAHEEIDLKNPKSNTRNAGFTIEKASKELGISTVTLRSYETNKTIPTVKMMNKMLNLYNAKFSNIDDVTESNELIVK